MTISITNEEWDGLTAENFDTTTPLRAVDLEDQGFSMINRYRKHSLVDRVVPGKPALCPVDDAD